jgi:hypothetical protein
MLLSVRLEILLIFIQDRCKVCAECIVSSEIILDASDGTPDTSGPGGVGRGPIN